MIPGYFRITSRRPSPCAHCGHAIPAHAVAWWTPRRDVAERLLCEGCYVAIGRDRVIGQQAALERAGREAER